MNSYVHVATCTISRLPMAPRRLLCNCSEFLTISTIVLLLISAMLAIILTFPIIMLLRYSIPANSTALEWNKYTKNLRYNQTRSWNAKSSHSLCTSKGFNGCCTVATIESGIAAITITSSQVHNYMCCKLIPIFTVWRRVYPLLFPY